MNFNNDNRCRIHLRTACSIGRLISLSTEEIWKCFNYHSVLWNKYFVFYYSKRLEVKLFYGENGETSSFSGPFSYKNLPSNFLARLTNLYTFKCLKLTRKIIRMWITRMRDPLYAEARVHWSCHTFRSQTSDTHVNSGWSSKVSTKESRQKMHYYGVDKTPILSFRNLTQAIMFSYLCRTWRTMRS